MPPEAIPLSRSCGIRIPSGGWYKAWQGRQDLDGPQRGSLLGEDEFLRPGALFPRSLGVHQTITYGGGQLATISHYACRIGGKQQLDDVPKVLRIRTEKNRCSVTCRFDHVLAPAIRQAAADKRHVGQSPARGQFAQGIEQEHRLARPRRRIATRYVRAAAKRQTAGLD